MAIGKTEKIHPQNGMVIRYKGIIDIDSLYKSAKSWFGNNSYDYFEKENTEKLKPQGNTVIIKMYGTRKIDDYVQFKVEIVFDEILRLKKTERGYTGEARIVIKAEMTLDYENKWKSFPFLFYLYNNHILKKKIKNYYWPKIYDEMMDLNSLIKSKLGLIE